MRSRGNRSTWRTKAAARLLEIEDADTVEDAIESRVARLRRAAVAKGMEKGTVEPPYDPAVFASLLGVHDVRPKELDTDGQVRWDVEGMVIEYDSTSQSSQRNRFTIAHEVGHMILWEITDQVRRVPYRRITKRSEIEQICNKFASEILAPRREVRTNFDSRRKIGFFSACEFIMDLTTRYNVSVQFAAIRFRETCAPWIGVALVNKVTESYKWCIAIPDRDSLISALQELTLEEVSGGRGECISFRKGGPRRYIFEWQRLSGNLLVALYK